MAADSLVVAQGGRSYVNFASNDYLGLRMHPEVLAAAQEATLRYGAGAGASRLVTGNHPLYAPLEDTLAAMKGAEAALVFGSGYLTNLGVITALMGSGDAIFADKLVHACILDGAQLSGAKVLRFRHNDVGHLEALLKGHRHSVRNALIVTEHVFSMDGDVAPLEIIAELGQRYDAWTMADDAHGFGLIDPPVMMDIWTGTLSKAAGGYGGYVLGSRALVDYLINSARSFIFSTGLPPASCAAALAALQVMQREPERGSIALMLAQRLALALGLPNPAAAIVPLMAGSAEAAVAVSDALAAQGFLVPAIRPPTVPPGTSRLRLAFSCDHSAEQVDGLIAAMAEMLV